MTAQGKLTASVSSISATLLYLSIYGKQRSILFIRLFIVYFLYLPSTGNLQISSSLYCTVFIYLYYIFYMQ